MVDPPAMNRLRDLKTFYELLDALAVRQCEPRPLADVLKLPIPGRGVYFFFENGEKRLATGNGQRVTRVGTHALIAGSKSTLRGRLRQHGGTNAGGGNHRGSIFRLLIGDALIRAGIHEGCKSWGDKDFKRSGMDRPSALLQESELERAVSARMAAMHVMCLDIADEPGPDSLRGMIERNSIALLSNKDKAPIDAQTECWLGHHSSRDLVRSSGLWNQNHVDEQYDSDFLEELERLIAY